MSRRVHSYGSIRELLPTFKERKTAILLATCLMSAAPLNANAFFDEEPEERPPTDLEGLEVTGPRFITFYYSLSLLGGNFGFFNPVFVGAVATGEAVDPAKDPCENSGAASGTTSQPVDIATGVKLLSELDFTSGQGEGALSMLRTYRSTRSGSGIFGGKWSATIEQTLSFKYALQECHGQLAGPLACSATGDPLSIMVRYGSGAGRTFDAAGSGTWVSEDGATISKSGTDWVLSHSEGGVETYNAHGQAVSIMDARGVGNQYAYISNRLATVTNSSGRSMGFTWSGNRVSAVTAPNGKTYGYGYTGGYLTSVTLPDSLGTRTYHYEDSAHPGGLTGVTINGIRHSRFSYYPDGRVKKSGLGSTGDFDSSSFTYAADHVNVTNALGQTTQYLVNDLDGTRRIIGIERPASAACPGGWQRYTGFDANGNVDFREDAYGVRTQYAYDVDDQVVQKIAGIGPDGQTDQQQITQYEWDPVHKGRLLKIKVFGTSTSEPISETTYAYYPDTDPRRRLLQSVTVKNTSSHGVPNSTQVTSYDYTIHPNNLIATMTVDGPVAGTADAIVYTFDAAGNQISVKNSLNHATSYTNYTALGLPGRVTGLNGAITDFTYLCSCQPPAAVA